MKKLVLCLTMLMVTQYVAGQSLFRGIEYSAPGLLDTKAFSAMTAQVDITLLAEQDASFFINLPDGQQLFVVSHDKKTNSINSLSWSGVLANQPDSSLSLSVYEDAVAGSIHTDKAVYEIQPLGGFRVRVLELNSSAFPECGGAEIVPANNFKSSLDGAVKNNRGAETIDVIVVYTPQARVGAGGDAAIKATAQAAVDAMNSSLDNSLVETTIDLRYAGLVNYNDTNDSGADLSWIQSSTEVRALLDIYGADMAGLLVESMNGACGRGYVMRSPGPGFRDFAVQVTARGCAVGNLSFAHEFGHNLGLEHNPENSDATSATASYPWSFGHYHNGSYRTVMSYSRECGNGCSRRQYFSNPNVDFNALPTGITDERENARTLVLTSPITADFRTRLADLIFKSGFE